LCNPLLLEGSCCIKHPAPHASGAQPAAPQGKGPGRAACYNGMGPGPRGTQLAPATGTGTDSMPHAADAHQDTAPHAPASKSMPPHHLPGGSTGCCPAYMTLCIKPRGPPPMSYNHTTPKTLSSRSQLQAQVLANMLTPLGRPRSSKPGGGPGGRTEHYCGSTQRLRGGCYHT
jgi:hypothetical protein